MRQGGMGNQESLSFHAHGPRLLCCAHRSREPHQGPSAATKRTLVLSWLSYFLDLGAWQPEGEGVCEGVDAARGEGVDAAGQGQGGVPSRWPSKAGKPAKGAWRAAGRPLLCDSVPFSHLAPTAACCNLFPRSAKSRVLIEIHNSQT